METSCDELYHFTQVKCSHLRLELDHATIRWFKRHSQMIWCQFWLKVESIPETKLSFIFDRFEWKIGQTVLQLVEQCLFLNFHTSRHSRHHLKYYKEELLDVQTQIKPSIKALKQKPIKTHETTTHKWKQKTHHTTRQLDSWNGQQTMKEKHISIWCLIQILWVWCLRPVNLVHGKIWKTFIRLISITRIRLIPPKWCHECACLQRLQR